MRVLSLHMDSERRAKRVFIRACSQQTGDDGPFKVIEH